MSGASGNGACKKQANRRIRVITNIEPAVLAEVYLTPHYFWPSGVALMVGIGFGILGSKSGHPRLIWAIGSAAAALAPATIASGVVNAIALPYTDTVRNRNQLIAFLIVVTVFLLVGFLLVRAKERTWAP
jgi:hypothetical protein